MQTAAVLAAQVKISDQQRGGLQPAKGSLTAHASSLY